MPYVHKSFCGIFLPVGIDHQVNVEVEKGIKCQEVSDRGIVSVKASHEVIFEDAKTKLGVNDRSCQEDDNSHKANDELQSCLDELHCSKLSKGLKGKKEKMF